MAIAVLVDNPQGSQEIYEKLRASLGVDDQPLGGLLHLAGPGPNGGWRVIEVWESAEAASRFMKERFEPALRSLGFKGSLPKPEIWPVANYLK